MSKKLTDNQYRISADIAGNIATVWFAAGVVSPLFVKTASLTQVVISIVIGLGMTAIFTSLALFLVQKTKND